MRKHAPIVITLVGAAALSARLGAHTVLEPGIASGQLALIGGTIYTSPAEEPIRGGVVLVRDGQIAAVGSGASVQIPRATETIDCSGLTITAGFWNSHAHFFERKWADVATVPAAELGRQLQDMVTRYGFTSIFDIGSIWTNTRRLRDRIESGEVPGPRIRSTGEALVAPGAVPPDPIISALGYMTGRNTVEIVEPSQASAASKKLLDAGTDGIKVHLQPPPPPNRPLPATVIRAAVDEAHRAGKPIFIHPNSGADVVAAVGAGVDVIAHTTPSSGPWNETIITAMKERRVALMPTLTVWKSLLRHDRVSVQEQSVATAVAQLRAWVVSGGTVLFGNDLGAVDYDPTEEYVLMAEAGMSFRQILASLTTSPAERFGASAERGRIAPGFAADLTVLRGDPAKDIRGVASVQYTVRDGMVIYRAPRDKVIGGR
jgi:imidazolonepropionase-like amidohydrolase